MVSAGANGSLATWDFRVLSGTTVETNGVRENAQSARIIRSPMATMSLLFGLRDRVSRRPYIAAGCLLAVLKFAVDFAIVYGFTGRSWHPLGYLIPSIILRDMDMGSVPEWMHLCVAAASMPFLWVGLSMSMRRAADAGVTPWLGALFVVLVAVAILVIVAVAILFLVPAQLSVADVADDADNILLTSFSDSLCLSISVGDCGRNNGRSQRFCDFSNHHIRSSSLPLFIRGGRWRGRRRLRQRRIIRRIGIRI
jgi:uncharacterized membrane protein YhaH (DUF805 family)